MIGCDGFDESMVDYVIHADSATLEKYVTSLFEDESAASKFCEEFRRRNVVADGFQDGEEKVEDKDLTQFKILTGSDDATAKYYLGKMRLQDAVNAFFETRVYFFSVHEERSRSLCVLTSANSIAKNPLIA